MKHKIESIYIGSPYFQDYSDAENSELLTEINKINIFIGANNSGKSRFTRTLFAKEDIGFNYSGIKLNAINEIINELKHSINLYFETHFIEDYAGIKHKIFKDLQPLTYVYKELDIKSYLTDHIIFFKNTDGNASLTQIQGTNHVRHYLKTFLNNLGVKFLEKLENLNLPDKVRFEYEKIYIPTLRGLRTILPNPDNKHQDLYNDRTKLDYFSEDEHIGENIYTGLRLYQDIKSLLLGSRSERDIVKNFEEFLSLSFFNGQTVNIIPNEKDNVVHVLIGDDPEDEKPIYQLGDGIQAIICLTYPLFINKGKELKVFIEEPEHFLHPGYQRIFMETLMHKDFNTYQYFITTHSNHLLDITLDLEHISVYTFKRNQLTDGSKFIIENVENEESNILELIGARNASVFLSNCTIWVEGITDRIYIRKFLQVYQYKKLEEAKVKITKPLIFKEDTHYSFVEYGGGNITHWSFLEDSDPLHSNIAVERLCGKLFLVSDKDGAGLTIDNKKNINKPKKFERHKKLKANLGNRYYCLKSREIENTLMPKVLMATIREKEKTNASKLNFSDFEYLNYKNEPIGNFIKENVKGIKKVYADKSGTMSSKVDFAKRAVNHIESFDDLSEDAKELTKKIYEFIKENNK